MLSKAEIKRRRAEANRLASKRYKEKDSSVVCPICGVRFPMLKIREHLAAEHPAARVPDKDLRSKTYVRRTRAKGTKPPKGKIFSAKPFQGGAPGLGSR